MTEIVECVKCGKAGIETSEELTPDKGQVIKVRHDDGSVCEFVEYSSLSTFLVRDEKIHGPQNMKCPVCGDEGRIANYRPNKDRKFHKWKYFIVHESLRGYWGKDQKVKKRRRCYMKTEAQTNKILKRLGRLGR